MAALRACLSEPEQLRKSTTKPKQAESQKPSEKKEAIKS
jgi:hypothetical protein